MLFNSTVYWDPLDIMPTSRQTYFMAVVFLFFLTPPLPRLTDFPFFPLLFQFYCLALPVKRASERTPCWRTLPLPLCGSFEGENLCLCAAPRFARKAESFQVLHSNVDDGVEYAAAEIFFVCVSRENLVDALIFFAANLLSSRCLSHSQLGNGREFSLNFLFVVPPHLP